MTARERLLHAVDAMTEEEAGAALRTLAEASGDPVGWMLDHMPLPDASMRKTSGSPSATALDRAIADDLAGGASRYPERVAFIDADEPKAGREIMLAIDNGYAVALVSSDGREHILTRPRPHDAR